jgi:hypothetical protein
VLSWSPRAVGRADAKGAEHGGFKVLRAIETPSQYKLEFTADQLTSMKPNLIAKNIDVTKFVRLGKVIVA